MSKSLAALATILSIVTLAVAMQHQTFSWANAGGPKLRMFIAGTGSPTVIFDTGAEFSLEGWGSVPSEVSKFAKTVSYDRAGNGLSDKPTSPRDARHVAVELHTALGNANVPPPYILVGHSLGGPYVRVFAGMYPNEVVGMILVDPSQEETFEWNWQNGGATRPSDQCTADDEIHCISPILEQAHESRVPPNIPVFLIHILYPWGPAPFPSKSRDEIARTNQLRVQKALQFHQEWIDKIRGAELIVTENSSHGLINFEEPELIIGTIRRVVDSAKR